MRNPHRPRRWPWWPQNPTARERATVLKAYEIARRAGLKFEPGKVEVRFFDEPELRLNGMADWKELPVLVWLQKNLDTDQLLLTVLHELRHAADALRYSDIDEWSYEQLEGRARQFERACAVAEGLTV